MTFENDYFIGADGKTVKLSSLFGGLDRLVLVHNMGNQCPYCTICADGFSDNCHRIAQKLAIAFTSRESIGEQAHNTKRMS